VPFVSEAVSRLRVFRVFRGSSRLRKP